MGLLGGDGQDQPETIQYLWPENVDAWRWWCNVQTQWRTGMGGATGLDYAGVRAYLELQGLQADQLRDIFEGLRAAEAATLEVWTEQRRQEDQQQRTAPPR